MQVVGLFMALGFWTVSAHRLPCLPAARETAAVHPISNSTLLADVSLPASSPPPLALPGQACYAVQPSRTVASVARSRRGAQMQRAYTAAMAQATATVQRLSWLRQVGGVARWLGWLGRRPKPLAPVAQRLAFPSEG